MFIPIIGYMVAFLAGIFLYWYTQRSIQEGTDGLICLLTIFWIVTTLCIVMLAFRFYEYGEVVGVFASIACLWGALGALVLAISEILLEAI